MVSREYRVRRVELLVPEVVRQRVLRGARELDLVNRSTFPIGAFELMMILRLVRVDSAATAGYVGLRVPRRDQSSANSQDRRGGPNVKRWEHG